VSSYYLCDTCRKQAGRAEMGNWCCLAPGKGRMRYADRKAICDGQRAQDVCGFYTPKKEGRDGR
jgi:hypothetical protein